MSLQPLIKKQKIQIDDHKRGSKEIKNWDDSTADIHVHKETLYPIEGKKQKVTIKIPINSQSPVTITSKVKGSKSHLQEIPKDLKNEIQKAFENTKIRTKFVKGVVDTLKNFDSVLADEEKARDALNRISENFELEWTGKKISTYVDDALIQYTQIYTSKDKTKYQITIDKEKLKISELTKYSKTETRLNKI